MLTCSIYCRVIDNFGDAGVAWRLARTLVKENHWQVSLIIDNIDTLSKFVPEIDSLLDDQEAHSIRVMRWNDAYEQNPNPFVSDVTIEAFSCFLPPQLEAAIAKESENRPLCVIALDYLTAESYAEESHGLASPHPRYGYKKRFFFPGFTEKTGGLIRERDLGTFQTNFLQPHVKEQFLTSIGANPQASLTLFFFTYPTTPIATLAREFAEDPRELQIIAAPGEASSQLRNELYRLKATHVHFVQAPMFSQAEFDKVLLASDVALVRGEDSTVRAQLSGVPLLWTLYPQTEETHLVKFSAFAALYKMTLTHEAALSWEELSLGLNNGKISQGAWRAYRNHLEALKNGAKLWQAQLFKSSSLTERLTQFVRHELPQYTN